MEKTSLNSINDNPSDLKQPHRCHFISSWQLQALMFAIVIEDALIQLRILEECNNPLRVLKIKPELEVLKKLKYNIQWQEPKTTDDTRNQYDNDEYDELQLRKREGDRKIIWDTLQSTYNTLSLNASYEAVEDYIKSVQDRERQLIELEDEEAINRIARRMITKQLRSHRNRCKSLAYDMDNAVDSLQRQIEDAGLVEEIRKRYALTWQSSRAEQQQLLAEKSEEEVTEQSERSKAKTDHEQRIHMELELYLNISLNETLGKIGDLMNKNEKDLEDLALQVQIKRNRYLAMKEKRGLLEIKLSSQSKKLEDWKKFKEDREIARRHQEEMYKSAIIVQAWWRGLLVRRQLGPYKPSKRGKKKRAKKIEEKVKEKGEKRIEGKKKKIGTTHTKEMVKQKGAKLKKDEVTKKEIKQLLKR